MTIACGGPCEGPDYCEDCLASIEESRSDALASYYPGISEDVDAALAGDEAMAAFLLAREKLT